MWPSASTATRTSFWVGWRPWFVKKTSSRSSSMRTGRPVSRERAAQTISWGNGSDFPPNPPPTSGFITRIRCIGIPRTSESDRWR